MTRQPFSLPLRYRTPPQWAAPVLADPPALLNDHAHLEKKAAANALELLCRWPEPNPPQEWVQTMCAITREESEHLGAVTRLLVRRKGRLTRSHHNPYALELHGLVRKGHGTQELMDRLMISALIEVRSAERFALLRDGAEETDRELARLYRGLEASEQGHYLSFLSLASKIRPEKEVNRRWDWMLDQEAAIIASQPPGPRMHSGIAS